MNNFSKRSRDFNLRSRLKQVYKANQCTDLNDVYIALKDCEEIAKQYYKIVCKYSNPPLLRNRIRSLENKKRNFHQHKTRSKLKQLKRKEVLSMEKIKVNADWKHLYNRMFQTTPKKNRRSKKQIEYLRFTAKAILQIYPAQPPAKNF